MNLESKRIIVKSVNAYNISKLPRRVRFCARWHFVIYVFLLSFLPGLSSFGQEYPAYEEIALFVDVPNLGGRDMDILLLDDEVYLPITDLFDFLRIRNIPSTNLDTISGFFINQEATFLIDRENNQIRYADQLFELNAGDLIRTGTNLYLRRFYFGHIFGLDADFNFRTMSIRINPRMELPAIREMRQQAMRKNMKRLIGEQEADTTIGRNYPFFQFGMADWSANLTEQINGRVDSRLSLALGSMLAGGEATVVINYNSFTPFTEKQQHYLWRYVNNEKRAVKQVALGKIATGATSSIYDPVVGAKVTNSSTKFRRSFGTYTLSDRTEPEWTVELYVNNVLVDFTTADASGFFTFEVPLVYGNTAVRLKFYGPYGEERVREQNITIPFNFVPKKTFEYSVSAGIVEDVFQSRFSRVRASYGLARSVTLGAGVEYLSSVTSGQVMPFVNGSFRLAPNLLLSGEYSPEVRAKGTLTYRLPSSLQFDINYIHYTKGQTAINYIYREERKFSMSMPIRLKNFSVYNRLSVHQLVLPSTNYTTTEWLISGALFGISTNITTYGVFIGNTKPYFYSDFSMAFRLPKNISLQPRVQYSYTNKKLLSTKLLAEKRVFKKGYVTASYERNLRSDMYMVEFGFRYDLKFAQTSIGSRHTNRTTTFIQYARGSIVNDSKTNYVYTDNRGNVGRGAISIIPFLDKNANGIREPGEQKVYGLNLRANSGRIEKREKDSTIRIFGLEPYTDCYIEFEQSSLDNIAWRLKDLSMNVAVDPNIVKLVEVPINIVGEAAGMVKLDHKGVVRGIARLIVNIYNKDHKKIGRTLTEDDGYFSYFGLYPGDYEARIDSAQLRKLNMFSIPDSVDFNIAAIIDGDYVDGLDFIIKYKEIIDPISMIVHEEIEQVVDADIDSYAIQIGAFEKKVDSDTLKSKLNTILGYEVSINDDEELFKVRVSGFTTKDDVKEIYPELQSIGINEIWLLTLKGMLDSNKGSTKPKIETGVVIHEIVAVDPTSAIDSYAIQLGAFKQKKNANELRRKLAKKLGKEVVVIEEGEFYKVRLTGFRSSYEVERYIPFLVGNGLREIWVVTLKGTKKPDLVGGEPDIHRDVLNTFSKNDKDYLVIHDVYEEVITTGPDSYMIQLGTFNRKINADAFRMKLSTQLGKEVSIFIEEGLYKVRITGFDTRNEAKSYLPELSKIGLSDTKIQKLKGRQEYRIAISKIDTIPATADKDRDTDSNKMINSESLDEVQKTTPTDSILTSKTIIPQEKEEKQSTTTIEEKTHEENVVEKPTVPDSKNVTEEIPVATVIVEPKRSLEERLLDAEYRTGLYEALWPGVEFTIQIAASRSINDPEDIRRKFGLSGTVKVVKVGEWYRFTIGSYIKFWQAVEYRNILNTRFDIGDAFVVAKKEGKRIMLTDLLAMVEPTTYSSTGITDRPALKTGFSVQILATKDGNISVSDIRDKYEVDDDIFKEFDESDGFYRYSIGNFRTYTGAVKVRNKIRARGFRDAFVVGYKDGKRVTDLKSIL